MKRKNKNKLTLLVSYTSQTECIICAKRSEKRLLQKHFGDGKRCLEDYRRDEGASFVHDVIAMDIPELRKRLSSIDLSATSIGNSASKILEALPPCGCRLAPWPMWRRARG